MKLGVTGGIGSGKTSVCRVFGVLGIPVFDADVEAGKIIETDPLVKAKLSEIAGIDLFADGYLNRKALASLIFNDIAILQRVNSLIHPLVFETFKQWAEGKESSYVIMEAAILFESGADALVDRTLTVAAPYEERLQRVLSRSGMSVSEVEDRIRNQFPQEELLKRSDYVIMNSDTDMVIPAVLAIHNELTAYKPVR